MKVLNRDGQQLHQYQQNFVTYSNFSVISGVLELFEEEDQTDWYNPRPCILIWKPKEFRSYAIMICFSYKLLVHLIFPYPYLIIIYSDHLKRERETDLCLVFSLY